MMDGENKVDWFIPDVVMKTDQNEVDRVNREGNLDDQMLHVKVSGLRFLTSTY